jgi:glycogen operon protein
MGSILESTASSCLNLSRTFNRTPLAGQNDEEDLHVLLNMSEQTVSASLPHIPGRVWHLALDTSHMSPNDIMPPSQQKPIDITTYLIGRRTVAVLEARG